MSQKGKTTPKPSPKNTLFKYFAKTTPTNTSPAPEPAEKVEKIQAKPEGKKLDFSELFKLFHRVHQFKALFQANVTLKMTATMKHSQSRRRSAGSSILTRKTAKTQTTTRCRSTRPQNQSLSVPSPKTIHQLSHRKSPRKLPELRKLISMAVLLKRKNR